MAEFPCDHLPAVLFPWWIMDDYGGYSPCIPGYPQAETGATIANCVGWAWGRYCQIHGEPVPTLPTSHAGTWYAAAQLAGFDTGQEPALGAVICFSGGHVAIVEEIAEDGSWIKCSESDYGGPVFSYRTRYRANNWELAVTGFQGFIYNDFEPDKRFKWWMAARILKRRKEGL